MEYLKNFLLLFSYEKTLDAPWLQNKPVAQSFITCKVAMPCKGSSVNLNKEVTISPLLDYWKTFQMPLLVNFKKEVTGF